MKVTILMPNYNNAPYLDDCLESIKKQTYKDFRLLIVDDKSTDNSVEIINNFSDDRISVILKEKNSGIVDTLNRGLQEINTQYIVRMDGDDLMHPQRLEKLVSFMDENPSIGVCGSGIEHFGISKEKISYPADYKLNQASLIFIHSIGHASVIYRTEVLKNNNITYTNGYQYMEDYRIFYDLSKVTRMTSIPEMLYYYRREEYNNYRHQEVIKRGFVKVYEEILADLHFDDPKSAALLHYEILKNQKLTFNKKVYFEHLKRIEEKNKKYNLFPEEELKKVLDQKREVLFYWLTDQKKLSILEAMSYFIKSPKKIYYYFNAKKKQVVE